MVMVGCIRIRTLPIKLLGTGLMALLEPKLREFIMFCIERRGSQWPALYDEMARVAGQRLFDDMGYEELKALGLSLRVNGIDRTLEMVQQVTSSISEQ